MQKVAPEDLIVGDIVSFRPASDRPEIITDRIIEISRVGTVVSLTTQGDANVSPNAPIVADHVIGRYLYRLPGLGFVAQLAEYSSAGPASAKSDG
jgi:signal peptidase